MIWMMTILACAMFAGQSSNATPNSTLSHWTPERTEQIQRAVSVALEQNPDAKPYAVFDADNTIWQHDLEEGLLAYMSANGLIDFREGLPTHLRPIPLQSDDTPFSYYDRMCEVDHSVCYLWIAQIFSGRSLGDLRGHIADMMDLGGMIQAPMPNGEYKTVPVPRLFPAQIELMHWLQANDVDVWIVSAALEEMVRMVASDPKYGLGLAPERVIGVNLMLEQSDGQVNVGAMERDQGKNGTDYYFSEERMQWTLTAYPFAPLTWYGGKVAAIQEWIHPSQRPLLVAGDSPNDFYMQFYVDVENAGVRLRIHRKDSHKQKLLIEQKRRVANSEDSSPMQGWIEVTAEDLLK
jgi:phosphoserine phosphatase